MPLSGELYYVKLVTRMIVFSIAALGLDLLVGYLGLISFGHAAFMAIGAYAVGILASQGVTSAWLAWPLAMLCGSLFALIVGAISLRCNGLYFIFITLAFAQMTFYGAQSLRSYGGDDGFSLQTTNTVAADMSVSDPIVMFYAATAALLICFYVCKRLVNAPFGKVVIACRDNETRLTCLGVNPLPYKLLMFVISGAITALSGALLANVIGFINPGYTSWIVSGELLVMVILGGVGTLIGPVLGSAVFVGFEHGLSDISEHWMLIFGPLIVIRVLFMHNGIYGIFQNKASTETPNQTQIANQGGSK